MSRDTVRACLVVLLITANEGAINSVFSPFLKKAGFGFSDIGLVIALYAVISLCTRIPSGFLFERLGGAWLMRISLVLLSASVAGYAISPDGNWVSISRAAHGLAAGLATTVNFAQFMGLAARDGRRGRAMGAFAASQSGGRAVGNLMGGLLADRLGFSKAFLVASLFPLVAALILPTIKHTTARPQKAPMVSPQQRVTLRDRLRRLGNVGVATQTVLGFSVSFLYQLMTSYFPLYGLSVGLSLTSIGTLKSVNSFCGIITRPFTGELTRFLGYDLVTNIGLLLGALLIATVPSFQDLLPLAVVLIAAGVVRGAVSVTNGLALIEATEKDPERRGTAAAVYKTGQDLGSIVGPIVGGVFITHMGLPGMLRFAPLVVIGVYIVLAAVVRVQTRRRKAPLSST